MTITATRGIESIQDVNSGTIHGIVETGKNLEEGVKGLVIGILKGLKSTGEEASSTIATLAGTIIKTTVDTGADIVVVTKGLLKGVVHLAKETGIDAEKSVALAATGAVKAAYEISEEVGNTVKNSVIPITFFFLANGEFDDKSSTVKQFSDSREEANPFAWRRENGER